MRNRKATGSICGFAALYMWYTAYELFQGRNTDANMSPAVSWIFVVLFALAGVALATIGYKQYKIADQEAKDKKDNEALK